MKIEIALAYAVSAKNSLQNHHGFAPIQLVTGTLPNLPNVLNSFLPALQPAESKLVTNHLHAMRAARIAFMKSESSEKVARTLRHPVRACEQYFSHGEKVFYKRNDGRGWHGSGTVLGQLGTIV